MPVSDNSLITFVTETWLDNTVEDAEILIPGFTVYRGDRVGRMRGGSAIYMRDNLFSKKVSNFSNGVVDIVITKCEILDSGNNYFVVTKT